MAKTLNFVPANNSDLKPNKVFRIRIMMAHAHAVCTRPSPSEGLGTRLVHMRPQPRSSEACCQIHVYPSPSAQDIFDDKLPLTSVSGAYAAIMNTPGGYGI